jgi:F0F1-type ATP synthase membrane subunit b/b'
MENKSKLLSDKIRDKKFVPMKNILGNFTNQETSYSSKEVDSFFTEVYSETIKYEDAIVRMTNRIKVLDEASKKNVGYPSNQVSVESTKVMRETSNEGDNNGISKIQRHMQGLLVEAERMAEDTRNEALVEAVKVKEEARDQASELLHRAQEKANEMIKIAQERIEQLKFAREEIEEKARNMSDEILEKANDAEIFGAQIIDMGVKFKEMASLRKQA